MTQGSTTNGDAGTFEEYEARFERGHDESVATTVAVAIADVTDQEVTDLEPLGNCLDCEALDSLVQSAETALSVSFVYEENRVFVSGDGSIEITPLGHE